MARDRVSEMEWFVRVVEAGSFSAAAAGSGTTQSFASKQVAQLETRLGVRLLNRTTRSVSLTEAGTAFYGRCVAVLASIDEAEATARMGQGAVHGRLRVNTSAVLAVALVQPALLAFRAEHPMVSF